MDFSTDANANFEGLLEVNREICMPQMAEKMSPDPLPNCEVAPSIFSATFHRKGKSCDHKPQNVLRGGSFAIYGRPIENGLPDIRLAIQLPAPSWRNCFKRAVGYVIQTFRKPQNGLPREIGQTVGA